VKSNKQVTLVHFIVLAMNVFSRY